MLYNFSDEELERHFSLEGNYQPVFKGDIAEKIRALSNSLDYSNLEHRHIAVRLYYINLEQSKLLSELDYIEDYLKK